MLAGFADAHIARALTAIHENPGQAWTLEKLANLAGLSRTAFVTRFSDCMTMTPPGYITRWRMQIARQQLADSREPIIQIAEQVGYGTEAAFSRVFKNHHASAPATYRRRAPQTA